MKVAILGGSFNPPHFGHLFFANEVRQKLFYDKIIFVPSSISAHKQDLTNIKDFQRLEMIKIATNNLDWAVVSDCDIKRGGVTRTIDTINDIYKEFSLTSKPGFIIGDDLIKGFHSWKNPEKIVEKADLIVGIRDFKNIESDFDFKPVNNRAFPLSSSEIRERVQERLGIDFLLPGEVVEYIKYNELYK